MIYIDRDLEIMEHGLSRIERIVTDLEITHDRVLMNYDIH